MKRSKRTRDLGIPISGRFSGVGYHKNKKKEIPRKLKHKKDHHYDDLLVYILIFVLYNKIK